MELIRHVLKLNETCTFTRSLEIAHFCILVRVGVNNAKKIWYKFANVLVLNEAVIDEGLMRVTGLSDLFIVDSEDLAVPSCLVIERFES